MKWWITELLHDTQRQYSTPEPAYWTVILLAEPENALQKNMFSTYILCDSVYLTERHVH